MSKEGVVRTKINDTNINNLLFSDIVKCIY